MTKDTARCPYCKKLVATSRLPYHIAELHPAPPQGFPEPRHRAHWGHKIQRYTCEKCGRSVAENWRTRHACKNETARNAEGAPGGSNNLHQK